MNLTYLTRPYFERRYRQIIRHTLHAEQTQRRVLARLLAQAAHTAWGQQYGYGRLQGYEDFAQAVPVTTYDDLKGYIDRMRHGEPDLLWRGRVKWYAKSSGTTHDKSKFIPVSPQELHDTHYAGGRDALAIYLHHHPESRIFSGRALILGGSHAPNYNLPNSLVGDLSAILIENINPVVNLIRTPDKATALLPDFEEKRDRIARIAMRQPITNLSGVPSWMLSVLTRVQELTGETDLSRVWPGLEVFFHGGVSFTPYREQYRRIIRSPRMHYLETYNASEGFFGLQTDPSDPAMTLMTDYGVFYEFIPLHTLGTPDERAVPLWVVEADTNYAMLISTSGGLWRYQIGDTVRFTDPARARFVISGRTKSFINAFGEELIVDNAERGLEAACRATGAEVEEYTAAPVFMDEAGHCRHQWLIEFRRRPADMAAFATALDHALQAVNSDYEAKRYKNITLQPLEVVEARPGLFNHWLKENGKLGGQHKVPRLANDRHLIEPLLTLNARP